MPSASRIEALSGSSRFAFSSGTVACALMPRRSRLRPSWKRSYASLIGQESFHFVEDRDRDRRLGRLRDVLLTAAGDHRHLVLVALECDVRAGNVVEHDEVG